MNKRIKKLCLTAVFALAFAVGCLAGHSAGYSAGKAEAEVIEVEKEVIKEVEIIKEVPVVKYIEVQPEPEMTEETENTAEPERREAVKPAENAQQPKTEKAPAEDKQPTQEQKTDIGESGEPRSLGMFTATAYCPCVACSEGWGTSTATGATATAGRTIAVDPRVIPYGTRVIINGHTYVAEDCGGAIKGNKVDIYFSTHAETVKFGRQQVEVFVKE